MITIARDIPVGAIGNLVRAVVRQVVPDGFTLAVYIPRSLDLVRGRSDAKFEPRRKLLLSIHRGDDPEEGSLGLIADRMMFESS